MSCIDLRSDTITQPTDAMRRAMAAAKVGDDVLGEDPTIRQLEEMAAERLGKEAALFVASGTMANLICQMVHCRRGDEMMVGSQAHIFLYEQGGSAAVAGIHPRMLPNQPDGTLSLADLEAALRPENVHFPRSRLIALENTHNRCDGAALPLDYMQSVLAFARRHNLKVHVDGARIFNAAAALKTTADRLVAGVDSVSFCLSKGLAAPVGSLVCASRDFIAEARRARKVLGGGMRQAGILAAAGIVALNEMVDRLEEDHVNARNLAVRLQDVPGLAVALDRVQTNIVYVRVTKNEWTALDLVRRLEPLGVRVLPTSAVAVRAVTHYHVQASDIPKAADAFAAAMTQKI